MKELLALGKQAGLPLMRESLKEIRKNHKYTASYYRRYSYVAGMIRNKIEEQ